MIVAPLVPELDPPDLDAPVLEALRQQVRRLEGRAAAEPVATHRALDGLLQVHTGGVYAVTSTSLALLLMAGPSAEGAWCGVVGVPDLGVEAAAELGVTLERVVLVPDPGEFWVEVVAALVDVLDVVVVRAPAALAPGVVSRLSARLRSRGAVLVAVGDWPRAEARLRLIDVHWSGLGRGHGHLVARQATVSVQRGTAPPRTRPLWFPDAARVVRPLEDPGLEEQTPVRSLRSLA